MFFPKHFLIGVYIYIYICRGKSLNFYIGSQALFTNGNPSEEEQMTGKVPEPIVVSGKSRRPWSERVILLGPNECQLSRHSVELGNLPGDSNNKDRLQAC